MRSAPGPDTYPGGSYQFYGRRDSYIELPNRGKLDTRRSITIIAWIYHEGRAGPIFNYMPNGWGVHLWMVSPRTLFVRYTRRRGRKPTAALSSRKIKPRTWQYVAATYDYITGYAKLYLDGKVIAQRKIGRIRLATNYPVRMGARRGDRRYFRGRISCVMVFDVALNPNQIARRKKRCFRGEFLCPSVCQYVCLSVCLSVWLLGCLFCLYYLCLKLCVCLTVCGSVSLPFGTYVCMSVCLVIDGSCFCSLLFRLFAMRLTATVVSVTKKSKRSRRGTDMLGCRQ